MKFIAVIDLIEQNDTSNICDIVRSRLDYAISDNNKSDEKYIIICSKGNERLLLLENYLLERGIKSRFIIKCDYSDNIISSVNNLIQILFIFGKLFSRNYNLIIVTSDFAEEVTKKTFEKLWQENYLSYHIHACNTQNEKHYHWYETQENIFIENYLN